jgi:hypothetical protein
MKKMIFSSLFVLTTLFGNTQPINWDPVVEMNDQLFPSYLWATSNYNYTKTQDPNYVGDAEGQLGITVTDNGTTTGSYRVVIECEKYIINGEAIFNLLNNALSGKKGLVRKEIFPQISYNYQELARLKQPTPVVIKYSVYQGTKKLGDSKYKTVTIRSVNDCPVLFQHRSGGCNNLNFVFAAYVNDNNPVINDELMVEIRNSGIVKNIIGYQGNVDDVLRQLFAVWHVLRQRGIIYSSLLNSSQSYNSDNTHSGVWYQYVRTMTDALNGKQANCIDGTVLMSSILYKMGLYPIIMLMPGHAYLGIYTKPDKSEYYFLETTLLSGNYNFDQLDPSYAALGNRFSSASKVNYAASFSTFLYALQVGMKRYSDAKGSFRQNDQGGWFDCNQVSKGSLEYQMIDVEFFKRMGVNALNY